MPAMRILHRLWKHRAIAATVLLMALAATTFIPSLNFPFLKSWDDHAHVTENLHLDFTLANLAYWWTHQVVCIYMPVTMWSYMFDHLCWGLNPLGYRLQTLFWHLVMVFMVFRCFRFCGLKPGLAWLGAAIFAVHPLRLESVVWISERKDVLCGALYFWSLYCYLTGPEKERFNWRAWLLMTLALLCKPMAASLPLIFAMIDFNRRQRWEVRHYVIKFFPYLGVVAAVTALTVYFQIVVTGQKAEWGRQLLVIVHNFYWYTIHIPGCYEVNPIYPHVIFDSRLGIRLALFYATLATLLALLFFRLGKTRWLTALLPIIMAYLFSLLPIIGIFHLGFIDYADRYSYIPAPFLLFILLYGFQYFAGSTIVIRIAQVILTLYLGFLSWQTVRSMNCWHDYYALLQQATRQQPVNKITLTELGFHARNQSNYPTALSVADQLDADSGGSYKQQSDWPDGAFYAAVIRAQVAIDQHRYDVADQLLTEAYPRQKPRRFYKDKLEDSIIRDIIMVKMARGNYRQANENINLLLSRYRNRPPDFFYYYFHGLKAGLAGNWKIAEDSFNNALKLNPGDSLTLNNLRHVRRELEAGRKAAEPMKKH